MEDKMFDKISKQFWDTKPDPYESQKTMNDSLLIALKQARLEALREAKNLISDIDCEDQGIRTLKKALVTIDNLITQTENDRNL
jgi:hypothetical protein